MKRTVVFLFVAALLTIPAASAQSPSQQPSDRFRLTTVLPSFGPAANLISAQPDFPFSAVVVQRWEQTLSDGTHISKDTQETVMRDDAGRIDRGRTVEIPGRSRSEPRLIITIAGPVQHIQYLCTPIKICRKMRYNPGEKHWLRGPDPRKMPDVILEVLGSSEISDIAAQGTRVTRVIPEGAAGNDRPFTSSEEVWHSKQLGIDLQVTKSDPRWGTRTTTMSEISLAEPDPHVLPDSRRLSRGSGNRHVWIVVRARDVPHPDGGPGSKHGADDIAEAVDPVRTLVSSVA